MLLTIKHSVTNTGFIESNKLNMKIQYLTAPGIDLTVIFALAKSKSERFTLTCIVG